MISSPAKYYRNYQKQGREPSPNSSKAYRVQDTTQTNGKYRKSYQYPNLGNPQKKCNHTDPSAYSPYCQKVFERLLITRIHPILQEKHTIPDHQFGLTHTRPSTRHHQGFHRAASLAQFFTFYTQQICQPLPTLHLPPLRTTLHYLPHNPPLISPLKTSKLPSQQYNTGSKNGE